MVIKVVFQIPFDENKWDEAWTKELRTESPRDPHEPHMKI